MPSMYRETRSRSVLKTLSWRVTATLTTAVLILIVTGRADLALLVGGIEFLAKIIIYFFHERLWNRIPFGRRETQAAVIWFTGLSGAGKSAVSRKVIDALKKRSLRVEPLDGDVIRNKVRGIGYSKKDREDHIRRAAYLASRLEQNGNFVVSSFISPYRSGRRFARNSCKNFVEVYVSTPLEECEKRDPKGLYKKARRGQISDFTGITAPYEVPENPEITIDTSILDPDAAAKKILGHVEKYL